MESADERERRMYQALTPYIKSIAYTRSTPNHWALNSDDLVCEAYLVVARCVRRYLHKLDDEEFIKVTCKSIVNGIAAMRQDIFCSDKRRGDIYIGSFEDQWLADREGDQEPENESCRPLYGGRTHDTAEIVELLESLNGKLQRLTKFDLRVLNCLLGRDERLPMYVELQTARRRFVRKRVLTTGDRYVIACAMCEDDGAIRYSLRKIRKIMLDKETA